MVENEISLTKESTKQLLRDDPGQFSFKGKSSNDEADFSYADVGENLYFFNIIFF